MVVRRASGRDWARWGAGGLQVGIGGGIGHRWVWRGHRWCRGMLRVAGGPKGFHVVVRGGSGWDWEWWCIEVSQVGVEGFHMRRLWVRLARVGLEGSQVGKGVPRGCKRWQWAELGMKGCGRVMGKR